MRRALTLAIDRWHTAPEIAKIANVHTVGGIVFPSSPLAATNEELPEVAGFWRDIDKSRTEARRLLKEAGAEGLSFELLNRNVDQPYKYNGNWVIDEWRKIGLNVTQRVAPGSQHGVLELDGRDPSLVPCRRKWSRSHPALRAFTM
jgi:peptide/nickel transport system substrate-binding protein